MQIASLKTTKIQNSVFPIPLNIRSEQVQVLKTNKMRQLKYSKTHLTFIGRASLINSQITTNKMQSFTIYLFM